MIDMRNDTAAEAAIGGKRVLRYDAYCESRRAEAETHRAELEEAAKRLAEANAAYQKAMRALPPMERAAVAVATPAAARAHPQAEAEAGAEPDLTDHNYDGIQEYDNPAPGWWHALFIGSVFFSILYVTIYHFSPFVGTLPERHARAEASALQAQFAGINDMPMGEEKLLKIMSQAAWLDQGASIYAGKCALCHGENGGGLVGPNMTDHHYKNTTDLAGMIDVVTNGAANGAMPPNKTVLNGNEIALVTAYVASLRGTFVDGGKEAEGVEIAPWPEPPADDAGL